MAELLAPAGSVEALDAAIGEGADAVYLGLKNFNARLRSSNFAWNQFEAAVQSVHRLGKKIYVTVNTVCEERETERMYRFLEYLSRVRPDGLIVQDFGVVRMCQEFFPALRLHGSTQMNVASANGANLLGKQGLRRVVLARELGLDEVRHVKAHSNVELEVFVHGTLCVSESGLCLFSSFLGGKSANRGMCTQACRRLYTAELPEGQETGYYFSPVDLQLVEKIPDLMSAGIESFKIEGRMKSAEYVGSVVAAYRYLMDNWQQDRRGAIATAKRILSTDFARSKTLYWYKFDNAAEGIERAGEEILNPKQAGGTGLYLGKIERTRPASDALKAYFAQKERRVQEAVISGGSYEPDAGDSIRLHRKDDSGRESHKIYQVSEEDGRRWIDVPAGFTQGDEVYLLQTKSMSKRYPRVLPSDLSRFRKQPGAALLPVLDLTPLKKNELDYFPEGMYIQVSTLSDLHVVQAEHPVRIILELNHETRRDLLERRRQMPVSKKQIIISLDPYCPAAMEDELSLAVAQFAADGYRTFIANNLSHIAILRKAGVSVIAGPYLYTFNRWAVSFLENQGIGAFISPYENGRRNLEATYDFAQRARVMVTVFAYPALFRMRFKLPKSYDFTYFSDKTEGQFKVNSTPDGSFVMPEKPFSIVDKAGLLHGEGFRRILIDYSKTKAVKSDIKFIMNAIYRRQVIPDCSRFNWKNGFYDPELMERFRESAERSTAGTARSRSGRGSSRRASGKSRKGFRHSQ